MTVIEVTDATFDDDVLGSAVPVIVDFWAPWCRPCEAIEPLLERIVSAHEGRVRLVRVNIDENLRVPSRYGVLSLPTVILFSAGDALQTVIGARSQRQFEQAFAPWLGP